MARARDMFFHGDAHFVLYTERYHFFNRIRIKGIRHIIFYQPPNFPHFYYEMCNLMQVFYMFILLNFFCISYNVLQYIKLKLYLFTYLCIKQLFLQEAYMNKKIGNMSNMTVTVLYSKYDLHQLASVVTTDRAAKMIQSDRNVHMMVTGAD